MTGIGTPNSQSRIPRPMMALPQKSNVLTNGSKAAEFQMRGTRCLPEGLKPRGEARAQRGRVFGPRK